MSLLAPLSKRLASGLNTTIASVGVSRVFSRRFAAAAPVIAEPHPLDSCTEDESFIKKAVSDYAGAVIGPKVAAMDAAAKIDPEILTGLFEQGFMGVTVNADHGGTGSSFTAACLVVEELAKIDAGVAAVCELQNVFVNPIIEANIAGHEERIGNLVSQSLAGVVFHHSALKQSTPLRAKKEGDAYVLSGSQAWCTVGESADLFLIFAETDKGLSTFLIEKDLCEGLSFGTPFEKIGLRVSNAATVSFDSVKIPATALVGKEGAANDHIKAAASRFAVSGAALQCGLGKGVFDSTMPYLYQRFQFGKPIADFQGMQHQRAQIATEIEAARLLAYNATRMSEQGMSFDKEAELAAWYGQRTGRKSSSLCIEWLGGVGFTKDFPAEKYYRDSKAVATRLPLIAQNF